MKRGLIKAVGLGAMLVCMGFAGTNRARAGVREDMGRIQSQLNTSPRVGVSEKIQRLRNSCGKPQALEPVVVRGDFPWGITPAELLNQFSQMYESGKRMFERAYYDQDSGQLRIRFIDEFADLDVTFQVPNRVVENFAGHIETAVKNGYGEVVAYPDMGHVHMQSELATFGHVVKGADDTQPEYYTRILDYEKTGMLYHTAEQMNLNAPEVPDEKSNHEGVELDNRSYREYLKHRFLNRNLFGLNDGSRTLEVLKGGVSGNSNLVNDVPGYSTNIRFYFHANRNGCFSYVRDGQIEYFDISAEFPTGEILANQNIVGE